MYGVSYDVHLLSNPLVSFEVKAPLFLFSSGDRNGFSGVPDCPTPSSPALFVGFSLRLFPS